MVFGGQTGTLAGMDVAGATTPAPAGDVPRSRSWIPAGMLLVVFGFLVLLGTELALILTIPGINYAGADGKAAQAVILATLEFARPFHISNLNPLEGMGSQMMPMNVWVNPAYWPFAFFDRQVAAEVSGLVALVCYALACYAMARCFDVPRLPSIAAAQLSLMLFGPAALALGFAVVYVSIPGLAVVYAPHMLAFGLLARLSPERPQVFLIGAALFALLFYSLYCDPLWTLVSGIAWIVPFAVVTFSPLRRDTILVRCAVLGGSLAAAPSQRRPRIRLFLVAIHCARAISRSPTASAGCGIRVGRRLVQVREIFLLRVCAWLGGRHGVAAGPAANARPRRQHQRRGIVGICRRVFVSGRQLAAAAALLPRARPVSVVLDCRRRRLLGRAAELDRARWAPFRRFLGFRRQLCPSPHPSPGKQGEGAGQVWGTRCPSP